MRTVALLLGTLVLLAGCGLKGPLYLPDKNPAVVTTPAPQTAAPATAPATPPVPKKPTDEDASETPAPK